VQGSKQSFKTMSKKLIPQFFFLALGDRLILFLVIAFWIVAMQ
jgi:hypothetical protein